MAKCLFERATGKFISGCMNGDLPHDPRTHAQIELPEYPDRRLHRWDGDVGVRDATPAELAAEESTRLDKFAEAVFRDKFHRLLVEVLHEQSGKTVTLAQYRAGLVSRFKAMQ